MSGLEEAATSSGIRSREMYEVSSPPAINKRRSWTGRLRDRLKSSTSRPAEDDRRHQVVNRDDDEWMDPWASPKLLEGHRAKTHAQPVPTLQGSVFVAANFVYDYRQKYVADPNSGGGGGGGGGGGAWMAGPGAPHLPPPAPPAVIYQQCGADQTVDWSAGRGMRPRSRSRARNCEYETVGRTVFRSDSGRSNAELPYDRADLERLHSGMTQPVSRTQFRATDVNQNLGHVTKVPANERPKCSPLSDYATINCNNNNKSNSGQEEVTVNDPEGSAHPQTTVAVDRPGLLVSGQRICIFTGQDEHNVKRIESQHPEQGHITKVILRVTGDTTPRATCSSQVATFQRNCPLRRSLSDRVAPKMATVANFNDTTRLHQRTRSRGSLHELFQSAASAEGLDAEASDKATKLESAKPPLGHPALSSRFLSPTRPTEPPPPPPTCRPDESQEAEEAAPVAPPRRIFRYSKAELDAFGRRLSATKSKSSDDQESAESAAQVVALSPGITLGSSWVGRPLSGQMISWSAWAGLGLPMGQQPTAHVANGAADNENPRADKVGSRVLISTPQPPDTASVKVVCRADSGKRCNNSGDETAAAPSSPGDGKRRPVSRLWPSFTAIRRDRSLQTSGHVKASASGHTSDAAPHGGTQPVADDMEPETDHRYTDEHIYEEIDEKREPPDGDSDGVDHRSLEPVGLSRVGRGSFAGASRQDILRYLEELRKKSAESSALASCGHSSSNETPRTLSPVSPQASVTPSLPQLLPSDDYMAEDEDMGALLLAMRHNAPNRHSNRSNASSSQSSEESALSASVPLAGSYQVKNTFNTQKTFSSSGQTNAATPALSGRVIT